MIAGPRSCPASPRRPWRRAPRRRLAGEAESATTARGRRAARAPPRRSRRAPQPRRSPARRRPCRTGSCRGRRDHGRRHTRVHRLAPRRRRGSGDRGPALDQRLERPRLPAGLTSPSSRSRAAIAAARSGATLGLRLLPALGARAGPRLVIRQRSWDDDAVEGHPRRPAGRLETGATGRSSGQPRHRYAIGSTRAGMPSTARRSSGR